MPSSGSPRRQCTGFFAVFAVLTLACAGAGLSGGTVTAQAEIPLFVRDIAPILDKKGCSTAGCHGKFGGRGGFQLSLLTLSPEDDYDPIVRHSRGRRVNFVEPEKSLFLLKATGTAGHGGGQRFAVGSPEYRTIRAWIAAGAPYNPVEDPKLASLSVQPAQAVLPKVGATRKLKVLARFTDGSVLDVTGQANYEVSDEAVAKVDGTGVVTGTRWGGTGIVVRYLGAVQAAFLTLPRASDKTPYPKVAGNNFVDTAVLANLKRLNVAPSPLTSDREFIRRVTLDVCGRLPDMAEIEAFAADKTPAKRARLIDKLLETDDFVDVRTMRLGDLLRIHPRSLGGNRLGERGAVLFTDWVRDAVRENRPYNQFVRDLLLARGSTFQNGAANFYRIERSPQDRMETVAQAFLGQRMACARCHKHPFDRWTTDNYWNFAAFMGRVGTRSGNLPDELDIAYDPNGRVTNQSVTGRRGQEAVPTFLGANEPLKIEKGMVAAPAPSTFGRPAAQPKDVLTAFADWAVSPANPYFARATVNRLWSHYLGRGVVHPVDDMRATTPPSVPGLLDALARDFVQHGYDTKHTIRVILNSRTYQTAAETNATNALDDRFFSHFLPRPMPAPVFLDALNQATGNRDTFGDFPEQTQAKQLELPVGSYFLDTFGRSHREFLAELEPKVEPTLVQTLHILNGPYIDNKIKNSGVVKTLLADATVSDAEMVKRLYVRALSRPPSAKELAAALAYLKASKTRQEGAQDLLWALISAREFYFVS